MICGSLLLGTFLSPAFLLSLAGAAGSMGILWLACRIPGRGFGPVGYSILAALAHMSGQFTVAWLLFIPHPATWGLFPVMMTAALLFGIINGIIADAMTTEPRQCRT